MLTLGPNPALRTEALVNLRSYKYNSVDKSYLSKYVLNPYWTWCAKFMPPWLAPNVITLLGLLAIYFNILCILIYIPDLTSSAPGWVYISFALGLFFYQTMDNIDGKQARRTNMSSPLGELFDHGIDSLNCCLGGLVQSACMGLGPSQAAAFTTFSTCVAMYASTWETYHTHVLFLGVVNGPTEGIILAIVAMLFTAAYGPELWTYSVNDTMPDLGALFGIGSMSLRELWIWVLGASIVVAHVPFCIYNVWMAKKESRRAKNEDPLEPWLQLIPIAVLGVAVWFWTTSPYSILLADNHLVMFTLAISCVFGRTTTSIILAHLTKQEFPYWSLVMFPLFLGVFLFDLIPRMGFGQFPAPMETAYLWFFFAFSVWYFVEYATKVVNTLCDYLEIPCFRVKQSVDLGKLS